MARPDTPLEFVGSSLADLSAFPVEAKKLIGFALRVAQKGGRHPGAKPLKGFKGTTAMEIVADADGDTYRGVYTAKLQGVIYVLHAFKKKSKSGIATPKFEIDKIAARLKEAKALHAERKI